MDDTISRQTAIDAVHKSILDFFDICDDDEGSPMTDKDKLLLEINKAITTRLKAVASAQQEIIRCKDCRHFEYDHSYVIRGIPVIGHLVCNKWGDGCRTDENGFCFMAERRTDG